ncbi:ABC transporter ATP-binding protein [Pseudomonas typographi]|uniref:ABC transporter ATP-binding protein n=1 Tax=Pseudomonas typographi TaxID=2715964 RepID=A0ABR7Z2M8_9PSED|nr:ABC transporter ATP-binding protein [Pseudomonas typographi]MBD1553128.1 ABC transporter ATP-binding protein [Pseudomonas typographi]MBD1585885.1 ABC transporter ATP-binding protein [Pseudomonas typographi]MBD1599749.1 ABC transporter ATP-binding protein [Pseudomonas typographi]
MNTVRLQAGSDAIGPRALAPRVALQGVSKIYNGRAVLDGIDLDLAPGEFLAVLGPSGTGKTTLLRLLAGLERVDGGTVGVPKVHSVVFQEPRLVPGQRVWKNVVVSDRWSAASRERALSALREVGLQDKAQSWPKDLSGGEAQRVALARALVHEPELLLLDEPFAALDALTRIKMHALVDELWRAHLPTVVLVTHDIDEALLLADRVIVLREGKVQRDIALSEPRPRDRSSAVLGRLRTGLLRDLGVDQGQHTGVAQQVTV